MLLLGLGTIIYQCANLRVLNPSTSSRKLVWNAYGVASVLLILRSHQVMHVHSFPLPSHAATVGARNLTFAIECQEYEKANKESVQLSMVWYVCCNCIFPPLCHFQFTVDHFDRYSALIWSLELVSLVFSHSLFYLNYHCLDH